MRFKYFCLICLSIAMLGGCEAREIANIIKNELADSSSEKIEEPVKSKESESAPAEEKKTEPEKVSDSQRGLPAALQNKAESDKKAETNSADIPSKNQEEPPDEPTQKAYFFEILPGEWNGYLGDMDIYCLTINPDLSFTYEYINGRGEGQYSGIVIPKWIYRNENREVPDQLTFEVESGTDSKKGGSFTLAFTELDDIWSMYFEPATDGTREYDNEDTMFGILTHSGGFFLERMIEQSQSPFNDTPLKNETFYVKFWGGEYYTTNELWLERVEYDINGKFFVSKKNIAIKYKMSDPDLTLFDLDLEWQEIYIISTDAGGHILYIDTIDEYNLESDCFEAGVDEIWDILKTEITEFNEFTEQGYETFISREMSEINGRICYDCLVGTTSWPDKYEKVFDIEACYSIDVVLRKVYKYDYESATWSPAK